jgi:hypothetical protein
MVWECGRGSHDIERAVISRAAATVLPALVALATVPARATDCAGQPQGEGHVIDVVDARSFRLSDGREIRLAGIEPVVADSTKAGRTADLSAIIAGQDVSLRGEDDAPDRYGRQSAFVFLAGSDTPVQNLLLKEGAALVSSEIAEKGLSQRLVDGRGHGTRRKKGHLGRVPRHKKRGKYRRYFDWDWAFYAGRGHGSHRTTSRGNDLPELRASLDTGLCCDYFEAQYGGDRICRHNAQVTGKPANSSSWLCRGPPRSTDRGGANRADRSSEWELTRHDPEKWASAFGGKSCSGKAGSAAARACGREE